MGVLSLFKKKKNYDTFVFEPPSPPPPPPPRLLDTFSPSNDAFTHGSLLDDVLNGLKTDMEVAPRLDTWQEQKEDRQQTIGESDNNRTSIYQQNMVTPSSPASMVTTTIPPESFAPSSAQLTPKVEPLSPVALESDISNDCLESHPIVKQQQQKLKAVVATTHRPSMIKSPSIVSSKPSLDDNNQEKRSRHSVGVSMSRMKERHRQECRRSLQPPPDSIPASPSFQQTPLIQQQQQQMVQRSYDPSSYPALVRSSSVMTDMYPSTPPSWRQQPLFPYQSDIVLPPYPVQLGNAIQSMYRMNQAQDIAAIPRSVSVYSGMPPQSNTNNNNWNHGLLQSPELYHHQQQRKSMPAIRGYQPQLLLPSMPDQPKKPKKQFIVDQQPSDAINNTTIEDPSMNNNAIETQPSFSSSSSLTKESSLFEEEKDKLQEDKQEQKQVTRSDSSYTVNTISNNDPTTVDTTGMNEKLKMIRTTVEQRSTRKQQRRRFSLPTMSTTGADLWKQKEQDDTKQQQQEIDIKKQQQQDDTKDNHQQTNFSTYSNVPIMSTPEQEEKLEVSCPHMHHPPPSPPGMHSCSGVWPTCTPPSSPFYGHHHYQQHYPQHYQHFIGHSCSHSPPPPCCPPPPPCCFRPHHHHRHKSAHKQCHHHRPKKTHMKKSNSTMNNVDDDAKTIGSTTKSLVDPRLGRQKQEDDNATISDMKKGRLRSFLVPRFTTSIPRQQQKHLSTSKSSYSWIPSRS